MSFIVGLFTRRLRFCIYFHSIDVRQAIISYSLHSDDCITGTVQLMLMGFSSNVNDGNSASFQNAVDSPVLRRQFCICAAVVL